MNQSANLLVSESGWWLFGRLEVMGKFTGGIAVLSVEVTWDYGIVLVAIHNDVIFNNNNNNKDDNNKYYFVTKFSIEIFTSVADLLNYLNFNALIKIPG